MERALRLVAAAAALPLRIGGLRESHGRLLLELPAPGCERVCSPPGRFVVVASVVVVVVVAVAAALVVLLVLLSHGLLLLLLLLLLILRLLVPLLLLLVLLVRRLLLPLLLAGVSVAVAAGAVAVVVDVSGRACDFDGVAAADVPANRKNKISE